MEHLNWRKSSRSSSNGGECVELAALPGQVAARDSKNPAGGILVFSETAMAALIKDIRSGRHDLP